MSRDDCNLYSSTNSSLYSYTSNNNVNISITPNTYATTITSTQPTTYSANYQASLSGMYGGSSIYVTNSFILNPDNSYSINTCNSDYNAPDNYTSNQLNSIYHYDSLNNSITISNININIITFYTIQSIHYDDISVVISGSVYTFTQQNTNLTTTITYNRLTDPNMVNLQMVGDINSLALLIFGYIAMLTGLINNSSSTLGTPGAMCQSGALIMLNNQIN